MGIRVVSTLVPSRYALQFSPLQAALDHTEAFIPKNQEGCIET